MDESQSVMFVYISLLRGSNILDLDDLPTAHLAFQLLGKILIFPHVSFPVFSPGQQLRAVASKKTRSTQY